MSGDTRCDILFIEDDSDDIFLFKRAFQRSRIPCDVHVVNSVEEAEAYLTGAGAYADREKFPVPDVIVTDLAFRGESGLEFLNWLHYEVHLQNTNRIEVISQRPSCSQPPREQNFQHGGHRAHGDS